MSIKPLDRFEFQDEIALICHEIMEGRSTGFCRDHRKTPISVDVARQQITNRFVADVNDAKQQKEARETDDSKKYARGDFTTRYFCTEKGERVSVPVALVRLRKPPRRYTIKLDQWLKLAEFVLDAMDRFDMSTMRTNESRIPIMEMVDGKEVPKIDPKTGKPKYKRQASIHRRLTLSIQSVQSFVQTVRLKYSNQLDDSERPKLSNSRKPPQGDESYLKRKELEIDKLAEENEQQATLAVARLTAAELKGKVKSDSVSSMNVKYKTLKRLVELGYTLVNDNNNRKRNSLREASTAQ